MPIDRKKADRPKKYLPKHEAYARLEPFRRHIIAGMSDSDVAAKTGVAPRTIKAWRLENNIKKPKGFAAKQVEDVYAISQYGESLGDVKQRAYGSSVRGAWEPPFFVTREHIDYNLFLRLIDAGRRVLDLSEQEMSKALGVSLGSVEQGLQIYDAILRGSDKACLHCKTPIDPELSNTYCSTICARLACTTQP